MATLGPRSINEKKFTSWSTNLVDVGLEWDTEFPNVSMPEVKIEKARLRIQAMRSAQRTTKTELAKLLGSLRHVKITIPDEVKLVLAWFEVITYYGRLRSIPLCFSHRFSIQQWKFSIDTSNEGLCAIYPAADEYIRVRFDDDETGWYAKAS
ncbi:hypothetical protein F441_08100 [Phytophthora nicotianae CJ01A1]|uniref:Uncharacterized protein n=3 Tax=Phytophthora nicotianae TaxID=4792 RepID=W2ZH64_PHYNI|nr:hypothetical protein L916_07881 [Phytophthora nicotianae]ETP17506.1 hypothetical protein F441_08100 [Phytophthora nicotianae CJ01A1]ETP45534.1 hypothetical protein F442_08064 [Phytophthora nicotianae P10297]